jgi:hypothetical protein
MTVDRSVFQKPIEIHAPARDESDEGEEAEGQSQGAQGRNVTRHIAITLAWSAKNGIGC